MFYLRRFFDQKASPTTCEDLIDHIFLPLSQLLPDVVYVVDDLHECAAKEVQMILRVFRRMLATPNIRLFISGRENLEITHAIPGSSTMSISHGDAKRDICKFIEWRIGEKEYERQLTENLELLQDVKQALLERADRM